MIHYRYIFIKIKNYPTLTCFEKTGVDLILLFDRFTTRIGGVNISNGVIIGGKDDGKPLFDQRSYKIKDDWDTRGNLLISIKNEINKYYSSIKNDENYDKSLSILANARKEIFEFFDNVKVNEENETLRKNRLELINMLCKTFQNFINFRFLKTNNE